MISLSVYQTYPDDRPQSIHADTTIGGSIFWGKLISHRRKRIEMASAVATQVLLHESVRGRRL